MRKKTGCEINNRTPVRLMNKRVDDVYHVLNQVHNVILLRRLRYVTYCRCWAQYLRNSKISEFL